MFRSARYGEFKIPLDFLKARLVDPYEEETYLPLKEGLRGISDHVWTSIRENINFAYLLTMTQNQTRMLGLEGEFDMTSFPRQKIHPLVFLRLILHLLDTFRFRGTYPFRKMYGSILYLYKTERGEYRKLSVRRPYFNSDGGFYTSNHF